MSVRLQWEGKPTKVEHLSLPFQTVETIKATAKVRLLVEGRRLRTFLATGTYKDELADVRWVA